MRGVDFPNRAIRPLPRLSLASLADRLPGPAAVVLKRWFLESFVPFNRRIGLRLEHVGADTGIFRLRLPFRRANTNVAGTVHGGVLMAFAETVHGVAILWHFSPASHRMFTRQVTMSYHRPARGALDVTFALPETTRARIAEALVRDGACDLILSSTVIDATRAPVATCVATYALSRQDAPGHSRSGARASITVPESDACA